MPDLVVIVTCEHGGNRVPAQYAPLFRHSRRLLNSHQGWDPGALAMARCLATDLGAPFYYATVTRLLVDLNRSLHHPELFSAITRSLDASVKARIFDRYYHPHRQAVFARTSEAVEHGNRVLHLAVHSFTPVLHHQVRRADVGLLYDPARPLEQRLCRAWQRALRDRLTACRIRRNYPYRGAADGLTTALRRVFPKSRYLGIELELNQTLLTARPRERSELSAALSETLRHVLNFK